MSTTFRRARISEALRMRSSVPSGRTMCCRSLRARSIRSYSNMIGVTRRRGRTGDTIAQFLEIYVGLEHAQGGGNLAVIVRRQDHGHGVHVHGGCVRIGLHTYNGYRGLAQAPDQFPNLRFGTQTACRRRPEMVG